MEPIERFDKYKRFAYFVLRLMWADQARQKSTALKFGMDYEDFDQIALTELWRCCLNYEGDSEKRFRGYVKKSIRFSLLDEMRRRGSLIKYGDDIKDRMEVVYFEAPSGESSRGGPQVDMHAIVDSGKSVEASVIAKITLEEKLSLLNEKERQVIIYKLASLSQKEIVDRGMNVPLQDHYIRTAYKKLGIERKVYKSNRKESEDAATA